MKSHIIFRIAVLILLSCSSCSEEKISDEDTPNNFSYEPCSGGNKGTCCSIIGRYKVIPGKSYTYTESTNVSYATVSWEVESGLITLISSTASTAVFKFEPGFTTGRIKSRAVSSSGPGLCESILDISKKYSIPKK